MEDWEEALNIDDDDDDDNSNQSSFLLHPCSSSSTHRRLRLNKQPPPPPPLPLPPSFRSIPGPAGAVQTAIHQKTTSEEENPIATQEYIHRAMEDPAVHDQDFNLNPWILAIHFLRSRQQGSENGMPIGTPLSEIINNGHGFHFNKVPRVVAIVKSTKHTEFGHLMVSLKDPTATIDATIHRKVLTQPQFANDLSVGAAIILQNVAVFSPSSSSRYLNVTLNNVLKVIPKEDGPLSKDQDPASVAKHPVTVVEACEEVPVPLKGFSLSPARTEGIMTNLKKASSQRVVTVGHANDEARVPLKGFSLSPTRTEGLMSNLRNASSQRLAAVVHGNEEAHVPLNGFSLSSARTEGIMSNLGNSFSQRVAATVHGNDEAKENDSTPVSSSNQNILGLKESFITVKGNMVNGRKRLAVETEVGSVQCSRVSKSALEVSENQEEENAGLIKKQKQTIVPQVALPEWTDEQLDELLA
ncbi:hypothetical protein ACFE04_025367 [Oxalis oulophora]